MFQLCDNKRADGKKSLYDIIQSIVAGCEESLKKSCHENFPFPFVLRLFDINSFDFFASTDPSYNFYDSFSKHLNNIEKGVHVYSERLKSKETVANQVSNILESFKKKKFCCNLMIADVCHVTHRKLLIDQLSENTNFDPLCALDVCQKCVHKILILKIYTESDFSLVDDFHKILIFNNDFTLSSSVSLDRFKNIKCMIFSNDFNSIIENYPPSVEYLIFGDSFNQPVDNMPSSCRYLFFGNDFNQPLDNLPLHVEYLRLGANFNRNINFLPSNLKAIRFGFAFDQEVNNLPSNLRKIEFGVSFNQLVDCLPLSVTHLVFGKEFVRSLSFLKKQNLVQLCLHWLYPEKLLYSEYCHIRFFYCPNFFFTSV